MTAITTQDLTQGTVEGAGVFDELMRSLKAHLEQEHSRQRIKGTDYANVYLGSLQSVMQYGVQFLLEREQADQRAELLRAQVLTETKQQALLDQQALNAQAEHTVLTKQAQRLDSEIAQLDAQTSLTIQQEANAAAEALNIPKQGTLLDAQVTQATAETSRIEAQTLNLGAEKLQTEAQTELLGEQQSSEQKRNELDGLIDQEKARLIEETAKITQETSNLVSQKALVDQQTINAGTENTVLVAQECKLRGEFDVLMEQKLKTVSETALLGQKKATEAAQTIGTGVDPDSVVGRQKSLYLAQTDGYMRDAEQKAAKLLVDSWNVRRTTDEATSANTTNNLDDASVGRAVDKLLTGVNA